MKGRIFNIQRFSTKDGPGIRTVVFLKGCPLSCAWCHNPESKSTEFEISFDNEKCAKCEKCKNVCPNFGHTFQNGEHLISREKCIKCEECVKSCPLKALEFHGEEMEADEVLEKILRDKEFYEESGGGITLSGGEPRQNTPGLHNLF